MGTLLKGIRQRLPQVPYYSVYFPEEAIYAGLNQSKWYV